MIKKRKRCFRQMKVEWYVSTEGPFSSFKLDVGDWVLYIEKHGHNHWRALTKFGVIFTNCDPGYKRSFL